MTQIAGNTHPAAGRISTAGARPRAFLASIVVALIFALGAATGMAFGPALRGAGQAASVGNDAAVVQAHQIWLQGELDSYGSGATPASVSGPLK